MWHASLIMQIMPKEFNKYRTIVIAVDSDSLANVGLKEIWAVDTDNLKFTKTSDFSEMLLDLI